MPEPPADTPAAGAPQPGSPEPVGGEPPPPPDPAYPGTDALGRPLTDDERRALEKLLRKHEFERCYLAALAFAHKQMRSRAGAQDVLSRALERLVRTGWNPAEVPLGGRLNRLVFSEWTHEVAEDVARKKAEAGFVHRMEEDKKKAQDDGRDGRGGKGEVAVDGRQKVGATTADLDSAVAKREREDARRARAEANYAKLHAAFVAAEDDVNLEWLGYRREGVTSIAIMARRSTRDAKEFYRARDRRKLAMRRLLGTDDERILEEDP
ncbi:MAG TPA: hypothetical protein VGG39_34075 [Polyangiaceae bacterium]|jgi:hypothetical protein